MKRFRKAVMSLAAVFLLLLSHTPLLASSAVPIYGDVDRNGVCSTADVRLLLAYAVDAAEPDEEQRGLADYDLSGTIGSSDARSLLCAVLSGADDRPYAPPTDDPSQLRASAFSGSPYIILQNNVPQFTDAEKQQTEAFELYTPTDALGRCGIAYANLCRELMPTEDRGSISSVTPTGWHNKQYDIVSGGWLYNRSHIIGFQLAGEQANARNLITGTRYMNAEGMLPFENRIADYIEDTDHHVLYRATPVFWGDNLLADGVRLEAWSVEDNGAGICFHIFCYNVQPGIVLDYATGENHAADAPPPDDDTTVIVVFILNLQSKKFHLPECRFAATITTQNRMEYSGARDALIDDGYSPCGHCDP